MKVKVYAKRYEPHYLGTLVWEGDLDCVPQVGEQVFPFDGWGGVTVERVFWCLTENIVEVSFDDRSGEYSEHARRRNYDDNQIKARRDRQAPRKVV